MDLLDGRRQRHRNDDDRRQRRVSLHRSRAGHVPGSRAPADRVLRRRRARRHGRRQFVRPAAAVQLHRRDQSAGRYRRDAVRLLRKDAGHAFGQRVSRSQQRRHFRSAGRRRHWRRHAQADRRQRQRHGQAGGRPIRTAPTNSPTSRPANTRSWKSSRPVGSTASTRRATSAVWPLFRRRAT